MLVCVVVRNSTCDILFLFPGQGDLVLSHTKMLIQSTKHKQTVHIKLTTERLTQKGPCPER